MKNGQRTKGRYQQKREAGLVPHVYDRDSRGHNEGAWKNWPNNRDRDRKIVWMQDEADRNVKVDIQALSSRSSKHHIFISPESKEIGHSR